MSGTQTDRTTLVDGLPPRLRSPEFWSRTLSELMDVLACLAVYLSNEVQPWPFYAAMGLVAVRWIFRIRLRNFWMATGYLLLLFLGTQLFSRLDMHPIIAAAHVAPIALAMMGLARGFEDLWGWRMGLGFIGLIVASALTPDFSVMILIIGFIVAGSIALSCRFLNQEFVRRGVIGTLPVGFIRSSLYQTGTLFIAALIIFPLIPRVQGRGGGFGTEGSRTGYTEEVNLNEWSRVSNRGSSAIALRIYGTDGKDPADLIPAGLLRSRVLSILADNRWDAAPVRLDTKLLANTSPTRIERLTIAREMTGPAFLPVPYGAREVAIELYGYRFRSEKTSFGEWREARSRNQRFNYIATFEHLPVLRPQDPPGPTELAVPANFQTERMRELAKRLFTGKKTVESKIAAVQGYYAREGFRAVYAEDEPEAAQVGESIGKKASDPELPPIERFLFVEKSGHCELYASAMAILLRMGGVPSRLIAGFRISRDSIGDVLTVRQSDAHAWVEAYVPGSGWLANDPTPKILRTIAVTDWLRDSYDWASAKWTQYILNYGEGESTIRDRWNSLKKIGSQIASGKNPFKAGDTETNIYLFGVLFVMGASLFSFFAIFVMRKAIRRGPVEFQLDRIRRDLVSERAKIEKIRRKIALDAPSPERFEVFAATENWLSQYEALRFGPSLDKDALTDQARTLRAARAELEANARRVA